MSRHAIIIAAALLAVVLPLGAATTEESITLVRMDDDAITLADLQRDFEGRHQGHMSLMGDEQTVRIFLQASIERRLFVLEGRRMELHLEPDVVEAVKANRITEMTRWLYQTEIRDRAVVTDAEREAAMQAIRRARHVILVQVDSETEARQCYELLAGGADPGTVAIEHSTAKSRSHGGLERVFWGSKPPELEAAIFAVGEGEVSLPVVTENGWVVTKVLAIVDAEVRDEPRARQQVDQTLQMRALAARRDAYAAELHERYALEIDRELLDPAVLVPVVRGERDGGDAVLARYEGGLVTLAEAAQAIRPENFLALSPGMQRLQARNLLEDRIDQALLALEAERRWPDAPESIRSKIRWAEDELVYRLLVGRFVFDGIEVEPAAIEARYAARPEDYVVPAEIRLAVALLGSEEDARRFLSDLELGHEFGELAADRSLDEATAARGGVAGWVTPEKAIPELRDAPFRTAVGADGGPIPLSGGWLVYRVLDRRPERRMTLAEARPSIEKALLDERRAERSQSWFDRLSEGTDWQVLEENLDRAVELLSERHEERFGEDGPVAAPVTGHGSS